MSASRTTKTGDVAFVTPIAPANGPGFHTVVHRRVKDGELVIRSPRGGWVSVEAARKAGFVVRIKPSTGQADERRAADDMTDETLAALYRLTAIAAPDQDAPAAPKNDEGER